MAICQRVRLRPHNSVLTLSTSCEKPSQCSRNWENVDEWTYFTWMVSGARGYFRMNDTETRIVSASGFTRYANLDRPLQQIVAAWFDMIRLSGRGATVSTGLPIDSISATTAATGPAIRAL